MDYQNPADESEISGAQGAITAESEGGKRVGKTLTDTPPQTGGSGSERSPCMCAAVNIGSRRAVFANLTILRKQLPK